MASSKEVDLLFETKYLRSQMTQFDNYSNLREAYLEFLSNYKQKISDTIKEKILERIHQKLCNLLIEYIRNFHISNYNDQEITDLIKMYNSPIFMKVQQNFSSFIQGFLNLMNENEINDFIKNELDKDTTMM